MMIEDEDILTELFARTVVLERRVAALGEMLRRGAGSLDDVHDMVAKLCANTTDMHDLVNRLARSIVQPVHDPPSPVVHA